MRTVHWRYFTVHDLEMDAVAIRRSFAHHIEYTQGKDEYSVTPIDFFQSLAHCTRDRLLDRWNQTQQSYYRSDAKRVYYLSMEFLLGRLLRDGLVNLGMLGPAKEALGELDVDIEEVLEAEKDAGLGNGGLGRLAACFLDSMATLGIPAIGCGIRYEYGIFRQVIRDGQQMEAPDNWLRYGNPWEIPRQECTQAIHFYGHVEETKEGVKWVDTQDVTAMAFDVLIPGYRNRIVNTLRLWSAKASDQFDFANFNRGDYVRAVYEKNATENISRVLYPNDSTAQGKELRLKQEYFFVSATLQDAIRRHLKIHDNVKNLHEKAVFQLNDTHPAIAVPELMRILLDNHELDWDTAWGITTKCFAYTNHTVLPEALEKWRVSLMERVLPRIMRIIYRINAYFLEDIRQQYPGDEDRVCRMSLIAENYEKQVHMAYLAIVGSFSVNGVSELHSKLLRERLFTDFYELWPEKFNNKTNGITPRRWLQCCNPQLARLITARAGDEWPTQLDKLERLRPFANDAEFQQGWIKAKNENKRRVAALIKREVGIVVDAQSIFDVQVKRIHEYKRQLLNIIHAFVLYRRYKKQGPGDAPPRTIIFGGKAAPGYLMAKRLIRLIHAIADVINGDEEVNQHLKVVFFPNYGVSSAEVIIPGSDLSEQISTAGTEASGTGNMKFALNGALTIGTLDGANIEIKEAVGGENMFIFGLDEPGVVALKTSGYDPQAAYRADAELKDALDTLGRGLPMMPVDEMSCILDTMLRYGDPYLVLADFPAYRDMQLEVNRVFLDQKEWTRRCILNVAGMGRFSSDATIRHYAEDIWGVDVNNEPWRR
ncbi:MAG: glycogen/starch/alpha-glucan phosphorylase [Proteobacteria bacterium]|nr:glycogen/starch/alpha-glucan phosphorylase [Pseudomonadota bacterium]